MRNHLKIIVLICLTLQSGISRAQYVTIPDNEFRTYLQQNGFASCFSGNLLDTTCSAVLNATILTFSNTDIIDLTGVQYFRNLVFLNVSGNDSLSNIPELPPNLELLYTSGCNLSALPALGDSLTNLSCSYNNLTFLPALPNGIQILACQNNPLTYLPPLPDSLRFLYAKQCSLTSLPVLPTYLEAMEIQQNQIDTIIALPNMLEDIICWGNPMSTLPALPDSLTYLSCGGSLNFNSLPPLPNKLYRLEVESASLTGLPNLPASLEEFWCDHNQITSIPQLPQGLRYLICGDNQLSSLPSLPSSVIFLGCNDNLLTSLPTLPQYLQQLNIYNNPYLTCLPQLNTIGTLIYSNTGITCLPNYGTITTSSPPLSTFPLCDLFNSNGCSAFWNISGQLYVDTNYNCINNTNEWKAPNIKVSVDSAGVQLQQTFTGYEGFYSFDTDTGEYVVSVDTSNLPVAVTCPITGVQNTILTTADSMEYNVDFGLRCKPGFDVGVQSIYINSGVFRPAQFVNLVFDAGDMTHFYGLKCASGVSGYIKIIKTGPGIWIGPAPGAVIPTVSNDTLIYYINDFGNLNGNTDLLYKFQTDTLAQNGDLICFSIEVLPYTGDNNILNNNYQKCFDVRTSLDPNVKDVSPTGNIDTSLTVLDYTISFQNTGSVSAEHIYIIDTLDSNLDASSFELTAYSHLPQIQIAGSVVRFNFPGINLPDSTSNEPESHGFISYRIRINSGLSLGTSISNTAHIYFDFNAPVSTNTTLNTIQNCNLLPQGTFTLNDSLLCKGESLIATAALSIPAQASWYIDSHYAGSGFSLQTDTLSAGIHMIELILMNNVCSQKLNRTIQIHEPVQPVITTNGNVLMSSSNSGNQWFYNSTLMPGAITDSLIVLTGGWFMVAVTDSMGCVAFSDSVFISLVGNVEMQMENIQFIPNPFMNEVTILTEHNQEGYITVTDMHSKVIFSFSGILDQLRIPAQNWNQGIYTVTVTFNETTFIRRIVKY